MAVYSYRPIPVPTPFQPIAQGGNPYLNQQNQVLGESIPKDAVPVGNDSGVIGFSNNVRVPIQNVQNLPASIPGVQGPVQQPQSSGDWRSLPGYAGWDPVAAEADFKATGGAGKGGGSQSQAPAPLPTYNIKGTSYTGNPQDVANQVNPNNDFAQFASQFNNDPTEFYNAIDAGANSQFDFLNKSENALRAAQEAFNKQIEADYQANLAQGGADKAKAVGTLGQNQVQAEQRKQDALNTAKQLYNQLQTGYRQRFGGASSAGEAAQTILGEEQQRQSGRIGRDYQNTVSSIEQEKANVEQQYQAMILDLQTQKQRATNEALMSFQNNLRSIDSDRTQTEQAKIQAKQQILLQLRDNQNAIAASDRQYQQQLQMMKEQAQLQLDTNLKSLQQQQTGSVTSGQNALNAFKTGTQNITSQTGMSNQPKTINTMQSAPTIENAVGAINPYTGKENPFDWSNLNKNFGV